MATITHNVAFDKNKAASDAKPNVGFKFGSQEGLKNLTASYGTFYLTKDTHQLYIGNADGSISPVNEGIVTYASVTEANGAVANGGITVGQFAYITDGNILAVYNGHSWIQINAQLAQIYLSEAEYSVTANKNVATITYDISDTSGNHDLSDSFTITGGSGITITGSGTNLTIAAEGSTLSAAAATTGVDLKLDSVSDSSVNIKGGTDVKVAMEGTGIKIESRSVNDISHSDEANGFKITLSYSDDSDDIETTITPSIEVGKTSKKTANFVNGKASLDVYSTTDIDVMLRGLNAVTYKGTVGSGGTVSALPTTNVSIGDAYITTGAMNNHPKGTLCIATGAAEDANGYISSGLTWTYVEGEANTTYEFGTDDSGVVTLTALDDSQADQTVTFASGNDAITMTANATNGTITYSHKTIAKKNDTANKVSQVYTNNKTTINVVTDVTRDAYGHVTSQTVTPIELNDTTLQEATNETAASAVTYAGGTAAKIASTITVSDTSSNEAGTTVDAVIIESKSLTVTPDAANKAISVELVWDSF